MAITIFFSAPQMDTYMQQLSSSSIVSHGGPTLRASDPNLTRWESEVGLNPVAIDRRGRPPHELITPRALPEPTVTMALRLSGAIRAACKRY